MRVWELARGSCIAVLAGHTGTVNALVVFVDGRLASASKDATVRLWDVGTRTCTAVLVDLQRKIWQCWNHLALAELPDGRLAYSSEDTTIRLWDVRTATGTTRVCSNPAAVTTLEWPAGAVHALAALPGGRLATAGTDSTSCCKCLSIGSVRLWQLPPLRP